MSLRYPVLEPRPVRWAVSKIGNHADRSRKTTRIDGIDKMTSVRVIGLLAGQEYLGRNSTGTRICAKTVQRRLMGASALTLPIRCCSFNCLHKRVTLNWTTTHCLCILYQIGMIIKGLYPLRAKKTFIRKKLGHTAVSAIKASSVTL